MFLNSSGNAIHRTSGYVAGRTSVPVVSHSPSTSIQISPSPLPLGDTLPRPRCPFKLVIFRVQTPMRRKQAGGLDCKLETQPSMCILSKRLEFKSQDVGR